jgi:hypothetical protein
MGFERRINGRALHDLATRANKEHWARKSAEGRRSHEIELLLNANVPLAEAIAIVDGTNIVTIR